MESAVAAASAAFPDWAEQSVLSRQQVMFNLQHLVKNHMVWSEDFLLLVALESTRYHHHCISLIYYWKIIPTSGLALLFILTNSLNLKMSILLQLVIYGGGDRTEGGSLNFSLLVPWLLYSRFPPLLLWFSRLFVLFYCNIILLCNIARLFPISPGFTTLGIPLECLPPSLLLPPIDFLPPCLYPPPSPPPPH